MLQIKVLIQRIEALLSDLRIPSYVCIGNTVLLPPVFGIRGLKGNPVTVFKNMNPELSPQL
jgi:hypothetical protein